MRRIAVTLAVLSLGFAPAPFPKPESRDRMVVGELEGFWEGSDQMLITRTRLIYLYERGYEYELRVDPTANPPAYDVRGIPGTQAEGREFLGIYRLQGDTLTLTSNPPNSGRPTSFTEFRLGRFNAVYKRARR